MVPSDILKTVMTEIENVTGFTFNGVDNFRKIFEAEVKDIQERNMSFRRKEPNSLVYDEAIKRITKWLREPEEPEFTFKWFAENRFAFVLTMLLVYEQKKENKMKTKKEKTNE